MSKSVIIIPSRLAATRLPNKPLLKIDNKALIMHVYEKALDSQIGEVYVATCDQEIATVVDKNGGKYIITDSSHTNGTERVYEASHKLKLKDLDIVINVQGDEPMINPLDIRNLHDMSKKNNINFSTLAYEIKNKIDYKNENIVKVVTKNKISNNLISEAINFYRKVKLDEAKNIYKHFGIYLYSFSILKTFIKLNKSHNELKDKLEQLRAIDNNIEIKVLLANFFSTGIDTKKDLDEYIKLFNK